MVYVLCRLKACEQRRSELFAKQGRGQQFATVDERDTWIRRVSSKLNSTLLSRTSIAITDSSEYIFSLLQEAQSMSDSLEHKRQQVARHS